MDDLPRVRRHNLPAPRTSFVGREREVSEIVRALGRSRLVTLAGTGGCGKTRLALETARDLADAYPGGTWLVGLVPLSTVYRAIRAFVDPTSGAPPPPSAGQNASSGGSVFLGLCTSL